MRIKRLFILALMLLLFVSCVSLQPVRVTKNDSLDKYTYFYITPTEAKTSSTGVAFESGNHVYGNTTKSTNPSDVISGFLIKKGLVRLPELRSELSDRTMIINYGETGRRSTGLGGYTIEVTLQVLSAKTNEVICVVTGEGQGETEADDIRIAINRCLEEMYK